MAACGHCWICEAKFSCGSTPCEGCETYKKKPVPVPAVDRIICHACVELIEEGVVGKLIDSIHAIRVKSSGAPKPPPDPTHIRDGQKWRMLCGKIPDQVDVRFADREDEATCEICVGERKRILTELKKEDAVSTCPTCGTSVEDLIADHIDDCLPIANPKLRPTCATCKGSGLRVDVAPGKTAVALEKCPDCVPVLPAPLAPRVCPVCGGTCLVSEMAAQPATKAELAAPCPACQGQGEVTTFPGDGHVRPIKRICTACKGTGRRGP